MEKVTQYVKNYFPQIKKYIQYIKEVDWTLNEVRRMRDDEFSLQEGLIKQHFAFIKYVVVEGGEGYKEFATVKHSVESTAKSIEHHIQRCERYIATEKWQEYEGLDAALEKQEEINFQSDIFAKLVSNKSSLVEYNIFEDYKEVAILRLYAGEIATLPLKMLIEKNFPHIKEYLAQRISRLESTSANDKSTDLPF